ncbi:shikimate dehydrogenase [Streptomyces sp. TRM64462]|uniref:shikimate dehydrogenase family protein n=1 Tax=Streptomyces sp. TRM64462 TaxID=2741726 RepID=UPI0028167A73|nr:shikimate dehydrogenase [Streptomyces sp. TRM64462]
MTARATRGAPVTSATPGAPVTSATSAASAASATPGTSGTPGTSATPGRSAAAGAPVTRATPGVSVTPGTSVTPGAPGVSGSPEWSRISGTTRLYAVLGDPVAQVQAPAMVNPLLAALGRDAVLVPVHAPADRLDEVVRGLQAIGNLDGLLVTVPHKAAVRRFADVLSPAVELSGSANALRREPDGRWHADNFDGAGFVAGLAAAGRRTAGARVVLVGTGGAGCAIAPALLDAGAARLVLHDLDHDRAAALAARLDTRWPGRTVCRAPGAPVDADTDADAADMVVNATPLGLRPDDPLPFEPAKLAPGTLVADIIMKPRETALLREAAAQGLPVHPGAPMLERQLDLYRAYFGFDTPPAAGDYRQVGGRYPERT